MLFSWQYHGKQSRKLRSVLKSFGATNSLIKVAIFHGGNLFIDHQKAWANQMVSPNQTIGIQVPNEPANPKVEAFNGPFDIAYEDEDFLVINKAAGIATVPAHHVDLQDSLVNRVKSYYQRNHYPNQVTHVATRLDKNTSGLVIFPKHRFAHAVLDRQLKRHEIDKRYMAIVTGRLTTPHGYISAPIRRDPESFVKREVAADGKESVTEYWKVKNLVNSTVVKIRLHTGRTHQIRVHFAFLGYPLIGDQMYGGNISQLQRQALHCFYIRFYSPFKGRYITCTAKLPQDLQSLL